MEKTKYKNYLLSNISLREILYLFFKRLIDILFSIIGIVLTMPLCICVAVFIKIESKGTVLFCQERVGYKGRKFKMYKFRSMVDNAEELKYKFKDKNEMNGPMFKIKNDPRVTRIGRIIRKTSIDELPQLLNVLKGEMSLVGPRPSLPEEVEQFDDWMKVRMNVKPGLTCYWQVLGRNDIKFENWMKLDVKYVKDRNAWIDLKLIFKTFFVLFGDKHAR